MNEQLLTVEQIKTLILQFAASFTLADDLGEVFESLLTLLSKAETGIRVDDCDDLFEALAKRGVTTLEGTELNDLDSGSFEEDEDE